MTLMGYISLAISGLALFVSCFTFWFVSMRRGTVKMTSPTMIGLGFREKEGKNQVFVRAMLYATSKRGAVIENMYARVRQGERTRNFSVWVFGETEQMRRGAGMLVTENGVTKNFHFLLRRDETEFEIKAGKYVVSIYGRLLNKNNEICLSESEVEITDSHLDKMGEEFGIQFDWAPDSNVYIGFASNSPSRRARPMPLANTSNFQ